MNNSLKEQAHGEIERIFRILLPQNGLAVREEQIALCHAMLDTLLHNKIALCDAGVGIGKTYAYLTACILLKKFYPSGPAGSQPVVVSTSSVALQDAIIGEYIPFLSRIFLENRIIQKPIRAMVRKGKERFVCDVRLSHRLEAVKHKKKNAEQMKALLSLRTYYDLDAVTGLSGFDRRQVCVPKVCEKSCSLRNACRYHQYLKEARSAEIFVQICNHNYLLADAAHRLQEMRPLLNDYRALVIDEAHKLPDAARQMYGQSLSAEDFRELCDLLAKEKYILEIDSDEARSIVSTLKREIKSLGDVNVGAIEEYDRVKERYEFLNKQKEDLMNAENVLLEIITEMDDIMKDKFSSTFNKIKEAFNETFRKLFNGGKAELKLTDPSNILETGIDIIALPPGKKLQHISLLSGGEKTLTAIALLFSILKVRPVPFCILDEVEAALDEVNVDNFGKYLKEFKGNTQFIIITHKKKTMEYADVLYGITMQESGVSKLVSVKLEELKN